MSTLVMGIQQHTVSNLPKLPPAKQHKLPGEVFLDAKCATLQNIWANIWQIPPSLDTKTKKAKNGGEHDSHVLNEQIFVASNYRVLI